MIADRFRHLAQYCQGDGLEFGEDASHVADCTQVRCSRRGIPNVETISLPPWSLERSSDSLDYILCIHYLEHFDRAEEIVNYWWGMLRSGGKLMLCLPEAGKYPRVGQEGCNPDHRVDFTLASVKADFKRWGFDFDVVEECYDEETFVLVVQKNLSADMQDEVLPQYSVVIPYFNNWAMTQRCVDSVFETDNPAEVILVDDGSTDKRQYDSRVKMVRLKRNSGFPVAANRAVDEAKYPFVVLLNNDVVMKPHGIQKMLLALKDPSVGMAGQDGGRLDREFRFSGKVKDNPDYIEMFCCAFRKSVWEKVGCLDLIFGKGYSEDADWGFRARQLGYRLVTVGQCCDHKEAATHGRGPDILALIEKNRNILRQKHLKGSCLWVMASLGCNGGSKVIQHLAGAMQDDGWQVDVCPFVPWTHAAAGWERFGHRTVDDIEPHYDVVVSTFHSTMPFAAEVPCKHRFALIQSDEGEWHRDGDERERSRANFRLGGFKHVIIADHMREFADKYGMNIVGQIDNGVDSVDFHPMWTFERPWPHSLMVVRKGSPVWYAAQDVMDRAVKLLSQKYSDLKVVVLGGDAPRYPCKVQHVRTFDEHEICKLYNSVSCIVVPSLIEGCSLVPLEAMASGCPVVSTRVGMDYARDGEDYLLVPYEDSEAIVEAVSRVFDDQELAWRLYKNGLKIAHGRTWQKEQQQWLQIINRETSK